MHHSFFKIDLSSESLDNIISAQDCLLVGFFLPGVLFLSGSNMLLAPMCRHFLQTSVCFVNLRGLLRLIKIGIGNP